MNDMIRIGATTALLSLLALGITACDQGEEQEPAMMATEMMRLAVDPAMVESPLGMRDGPGRLAWLAASCDSDPEEIEQSVCGELVPSGAEFRWEGCDVDLPDGARVDQLSTSGSLTVIDQVPGDCSEVEGRVRDIDFEIHGSPGSGAEVTMEGHSLAQWSDVGQSIRMDVHRRLEIESRGEVEATLTGDVQVSTNADDGTHTSSGQLWMSLDHPWRGHQEFEVDIVDLVRVDHETCRWPIEGSVIRRSGTVEVELAFGPECGTGLLDGAPVDLDELASRRPHGRRGRGFR